MVRRRIAFVLVLIIAVAPMASGASSPTQPSHFERTIRGMGERFGHHYSLPDAPTFDSVEARAAWVQNTALASGRSAAEWVAWAQDALDPAPRASEPSTASIVTGVERIYRALGLDEAPARAAVLQQAGALDGAIAGPFALLLDVVATEYEAQAARVPAILDRFGDGTNPLVFELTDGERDAMTSAQERIVGAIGTFRDATAGVFGPSTVAPRAPLFSDPEGLVVIGSTGRDVHRRSGIIDDPVLLIDPDGDDVYENSAGGACPWTINVTGEWMDCNLLVLSVVADLGPNSNDAYVYDGPPAAIQGAGGPGGIGVLVDVGGNDSYAAEMTRGTKPYFATYYFDGGAQGFGYAGVGALIDVAGADTYTFKVDSANKRNIWGLGQGFGGAGGVGVIWDAQGSDTWLAHARSKSNGDFVGMYNGGSGFYGGVGVLLETGFGDDTYVSDAIASSVDYYALAFGAFGGVGVLYEDGGDDDYTTFEKATGGNAINPTLNCAFGTASYGGVGVMVDLAGDDTYYGGTVSTKGATAMDFGFGGPGVGYGLFVDSLGDDSYTMEARTTGSGNVHVGITGHGLFDPAMGILAEANMFGTFVDSDGVDSYVGAPAPVKNNAQWAFGVDRSA